MTNQQKGDRELARWRELRAEGYTPQQCYDLMHAGDVLSKLEQTIAKIREVMRNE